MWAPSIAVPGELGASFMVSRKSAYCSAGQETAVGRKDVTPVLGSSRTKASKAFVSGPTSIPKAPLICRSIKPGQINPDSSRLSDGSTAVRPNGTGARTLPTRVIRSSQRESPFAGIAALTALVDFSMPPLRAFRPRGTHGSLLSLLRPTATVVPVAADVFELVSLRFRGQNVHEGERERGQYSENGEGPRSAQRAERAEEHDTDDDICCQVRGQHGRTTLRAKPSGEAFGSVGPHEGAVTKVESHGEEQDADDGQDRRGARGESDDEHGASDAHSGDPSQQYRSAPQPVDQEEGPHNCRDGEQLDDGRHEDGSARTLDAHLLDNGRTVVDDRVDPGYLNQKA